MLRRMQTVLAAQCRIAALPRRSWRRRNELQRGKRCYIFLVLPRSSVRPWSLAALLVCATPAGAKSTANTTAERNVRESNARMRRQNGVPASARMTSGSALGDLNGVAVEAVILPDAAAR